MYIRKQAPRDCNRRGRHHSIKESKYQERSVGTGHCAGESEDHKADKGDEQRPPSTKILRARSPHQRAHDIADEKDGNGEDQHLLIGDAEFLGDLRDGIAANRRADGTIHDLHDPREEDEQLSGLVSGSTNVLVRCVFF